MRVLFWSDLFRPYVGGIEILAADMLPRLAARGHTFHVVTSHSYLDLPDEDELEGIPVTRFPFRSVLKSRDAAEIIRVRRSLDKLVREFRADLVHQFGVGIGLLFKRDSAVASTLPTLTTLHNTIASTGAESPDTLVQGALRSSDWITTCSANLLAQVHEILPEVADRSSAILNGIEPPDIEHSPPSFDPPILICVGRLIHQKGFDLAIRGFALVADRYPETRLIFVGDGNEREELESLAQELGVAHRVEFMGLVAPDRVHQLLADATLVLMPSRWEGLPVVAVEAAMLGRPIIGTDVCGIPEVVIHDRTGLIIDSESPQAVADDVTMLLDDPPKAIALGDAARVHALESFTMERCVHSYDALYRQLGVHQPRTTSGA